MLVTGKHEVIEPTVAVQFDLGLFNKRTYLKFNIWTKNAIWSPEWSMEISGDELIVYYDGKSFDIF